jgi:hypothetical protein
MDFILCIRHSSIGRSTPKNIQPSLWRCDDAKPFPFKEAGFELSIYLTDTVSAAYVDVPDGLSCHIQGSHRAGLQAVGLG